MYRWRLITSVLLLVTGVGLSQTARSSDLPAEPPRRLLFVGNSFTYYNRSIHYYLEGLLIAAGEYVPGKTNLRSMTISGGRLREHEPGLSAMVQREPWDTVILQGYSTGPIDPDTAPGFREAAKRLSETVRTNGAEPAFLMTWPYRGRLDMTGPLAATYTEIGFELSAPVLPVGIAFARSINDYPEIELYVADVEGFNETEDGIEVLFGEDVKHPSSAGSYLAACVIFSSLFERSPEGLVFQADLDAETARKLQAIAWKTVTAYKAK